MRIVLDLQGAQSDSRFRGIGRYSVSLARAIAHNAGNHEVWLALSGHYVDAARSLRDEFADLVPRDQIRTFELPGPVAELDHRNSWRMQTAELVREKFLADLHPDVVHVSTMFEGFHNEVVTSVGRLETSTPTAITLYDLIPLVHPEKFLADAAMKRCYLRRAQSLVRADSLLAISESSRREAIKNLEISDERITTIGAGVALQFTAEKISEETRQALAKTCGLRKPFILSAGTIDSNKNLGTLIEAFGLLPDPLRRAYQLAISGKITNEQQQALLSRVPKNLSEEAVVFVGYVPDELLCLLYRACALFVLPSLHEGFGLPLVEAMACGAAVIGSNCASIPEIINRPDALFDPRTPQAIANSIGNVLTNPGLQRNLQEWGPERSKLFSWESCARKAIAAFEALHAERSRAQSTFYFPPKDRRPTLAFVSALRPDKTPIANYAAKVLPLLSRYYDVVCVNDQLESVSEWIAAEFPVRDLEWFKARSHCFERILYQFGNSLVCHRIFDVILEYPGIVELHDLFIGDLLNQMDRSGYAPGAFVRSLYNAHGFSALRQDKSDGRDASIRRYSCNAQIFQASIGVIIHSDEAAGPPPGVPEYVSENLYWQRQTHAINLVGFESSLELEDETEYVQTFERFYAESANAFETRLIASIAKTSTSAQPSAADLAQTASAIASNRQRISQRQLLLDVTNIAQGDAQTGIQRVTRALLSTLIEEPPAGFRVEPVRAESDRYVYARRFGCRFLGFPDDCLSDDVLETGTEDIYLGVEWGADVVPGMKRWFLKERARGLEVQFLVYDNLAILRPDLFPPHFGPLALAWIETVTEIADGVACISKTVADELFAWLDEAKPRRTRPLPVNFFHLGADLSSSVPTKGLPEAAPGILAKLSARPSFLMVGTIEPRKGHRLVFAAMEHLWQTGVNANLIIVGKLGWKMDDFAARLRAHPEHGNRLFWLDGVSDEFLDLIYSKSKALIAASEAEGFGLPLIEAARHGLPIIARDIAVFREVAGKNAFFFDGSNAESLASALQAWLSSGDNVPKSTGIKSLTWQESSRQLVDIIQGKRTYRRWMPHTSSSPR